MFEVLCSLLASISPVIHIQDSKKKYIFQLILNDIIFLIIAILIYIVSMHFTSIIFFYIFGAILFLIYFIPNLFNWLSCEDSHLRKQIILFQVIILLESVILILLRN